MIVLEGDPLLLLLHLEKMAAEDGSLPSNLGRRPDGLTPDSAKAALQTLGKAGRVVKRDGVMWVIPKDQAVPLVTQITEPATQVAPDPPPSPGATPWKRPESQNQHMRAIRESHPLKRNARLVAFEAHVQIGITSTIDDTEYGDTKRELTPEYLAQLTGLSENTARTAMQDACALGFFRRVDNGKGGRNNRNRATYLPTVPAWTT